MNVRGLNGRIPADYTGEKSTLTVDERLEAFLTKWEAKRAGLIKNYRLRATDSRRKGLQVCWESDERAARYYEDEAELLQELRARALP